MKSPEVWIDRYLRRLSFGQFLKVAAEWLVGFCLLFGSVVLVVKLGFPQFWPNVLWLGWGVIPLIGIVWMQSRKERFTRVETLAMLDRKLKTGGLLMSLYESSKHASDRALWSAKLPQTREEWKTSLPRLRPVRFFKLVALPMLFAIASGFMPLRELPDQPTQENVVGQQVVSDLQEMLDKLEKAEVVDQQEAEEIREEIEHLKQETQQKPLTHEKWETVDALRERMRQRLDGTALQLSKATSAARTMTKAEGTETPVRTPEETRQLTQEITSALEKFEGTLGTKEGQQLVKQAMEMAAKSGKFNPGQFQMPTDPQEREQMLGELQNFLQEQSELINQLRNEFQGTLPGGIDTEQLADLMNEPGKGGINRGGKGAEMDFGEESELTNSKFKDVALPPGIFDKPTETQGVTSTNPEIDPVETAPRNELRNSEPSAGVETWKTTLPPSKQGTVKEYFKKAPKPEP